MCEINLNQSNEPAIKEPLPNGGMGWYAVDSEEIEAVVRLLKEPHKLFRYRGEEKTECFLFEKEVTEKTGAKHALFVNSGTSALALCLASWEIGPGDEVIVPAYTYIATASAVISVGAVPVIAEIDESLGLDPEDVLKKITPHTKAVIPVHMQGVPAKLDALRRIAKEKNLVIIEDCCQAIGATYKGEYVGVRSNAFAWSLNYYKVITCGEGGVFFTNDDVAFAKGVNYSDPAMPMWGTSLSTGKIAPFTGGGFRGNELAAAMARVQLRKLDRLLVHTRRLKKLLIENLNRPHHYQLQHVDDPEGDCGISFAMIAESSDVAEKLTEELLAEGLEIGSVYNAGFPDRHVYKYWDSILYKKGATKLNYPWDDPSYRGNVQYSADMCPRTLNILARCLRLNIHMALTEDNIIQIARAINKADSRI